MYKEKAECGASSAVQSLKAKRKTKNIKRKMESVDGKENRKKVTTMAMPSAVPRWQRKTENGVFVMLQNRHRCTSSTG